MKTSLLAFLVTVLSLGTLALIHAQNSPDEMVPPASASPSTGPATPSDDAGLKAPESETVAGDDAASQASDLPGIRTEMVLSRAGEDDDILAVAPLGSIFKDGDRFFVLAKSAESDADFRQREVELGMSDGQVIEITEGLEVGEKVIVVSVNQLRFPSFAADSDPCGPGACSVENSSEKCGPDGCTLKSSQCGSDGCRIDAAPGKGCCPTQGTGRLEISAKELFDDHFAAPAPMGLPPVGMVPVPLDGGFCAPY